MISTGEKIYVISVLKRFKIEEPPFDLLEVTDEAVIIRPLKCEISFDGVFWRVDVEGSMKIFHEHSFKSAFNRVFRNHVTKILKRYAGVKQ